MNEAEWLACTDPQKMLDFLRSKAGDRKLRLLAVACDRCGPFSLFSGFWETSSERIEVVERYADGHATEKELRGLENPWDFKRDEDNGWYRLSLPEPFQATSAAQIARDVAASAGHWTTTHHACSAARDKMRNVLASVLRCMFNPFRSITLASAWLTPKVVALAQAIYDDRAFGPKFARAGRCPCTRRLHQRRRSGSLPRAGAACTGVLGGGPYLWKGVKAMTAQEWLASPDPQKMLDHFTQMARFRRGSNAFLTALVCEEPGRR